MVKESDPPGMGMCELPTDWNLAHLLLNIAMLCTTEGHIWQYLNMKLFSDGLISMKFSLPVLLLKPVTVGSGMLSVSDTYLLFGVNYISWPSQYINWSLIFDDQLVSFSGLVVWPVKIVPEVSDLLSIGMNLLRRPTSKALGRQKYNESTAASQLNRTLNPTHSLTQPVLVILHKVSMPLLFCWHQLQPTASCCLK